MSGSGDKWETVGKAKVSGGNNKQNDKAAGTAKKNINAARPLPKMEEVLPTKSLQNIYSDAFFNGENPAAKAKQATDSPKKDKKQQADVKKVVKKEPPKPQVPASLEEAIKANMRVDDLKQLMEASQKNFPDSPLLWLRDIAAYLNKNLEHKANNTKPEDPKSLSSWPLSALSGNMRKAINHILHPCSDSTKESFIETCISNMAHEMAKESQAWGWKILCQALVEVNPGLVLPSITRCIELRNSYQNRPVVGISILWAVGEAGKRELATGVKVWMEVMLPLLSLRHYSRFIVDYMAALLKAHEGFQPTRPLLDIANFVTLQDIVFTVGNQINKDIGRELRESVYPKLKALVLASNTNHEMFPTMMNKLANATMPDQVMDILHVLSESVASTPASLVHWHKMYISFLPQSGQLLLYLNTNWNKYKCVLQSADFESTLEAFQTYNGTAPAKDGVAECTQGCDLLAKKLAQSKKKSWFPWKTMSVLMLIATVHIINLDVQKNGTFRKSHCGQFLNDIGQYERAMNVYGRVSETYLTGRKWADANLPIYYQQARAKAGPALDTAVNTAQELGSRGYSYLNAGYREVKHGVDRYLPGLQEQVGVYQTGVIKVARDAGTALGKLTRDILKGNIDWNLVMEGAKTRASEAQEAATAFMAWARLRVETLLK